MNLAELAYEFADEKAALDHFEKFRWPNGVRCVACEGDRVKSVKSSSKKQTVRYLYQCMDCRKQFTAKSNTIFHDSHLPLQKWFMTMKLFLEAKKGISAHQVARTIGVQYKTAWYLCHRIREVLKTANPNPLAGVVEIDETYIGGKATGKGVYFGKHAKAPVMGLIKRGGEVRYEKVTRVNTETIKPILDKHLSKAAQMVCTDEASVYQYALKDLDFRHQVIRHKSEYVRLKHIHTNSIESAFSLLKRGYIGSFHKLSHKHLDRYLAEFEYRFNNRKNPRLFEDVLSRMAATPKLTYSDIINGKDW
jgi:transposase-like protein